MNSSTTKVLACTEHQTITSTLSLTRETNKLRSLQYIWCLNMLKNIYYIFKKDLSYLKMCYKRRINKVY